MTDVVASFELQEEPQISANFTLTGGTIYHDQLLHRDYSNQHPISAITDLQNSLDTLQTNIDNEASARENADDALDTKIDNLEIALEGDIQAEATAREQADTRLEGLISDEETRAKAAEEALSDDISAENTRAVNAEETLQDNIDAEETRAKNAEQGLSDDITAEAGTRASEITRVEGLITAEETARISADNTLQGNINAEKTARENADSTLQGNIDAEELARQNADSALQSNIDAEALTRGNADTAINTKIDNHIADKANPHQVTKAQVGLGNVDNTADIDKPISTAVSAAFDAVEAEITDINALIPNEASSSNQLADKEFVNSSISTNTADFIGTFASISDLEAYAGTVTSNDYAFVVNRVVTDNGSDWATFVALDAYDKSLLSNFDYAWVVNGSNFDLYRFDIINQVWELRASNIEKSSVTLNSAYNRYKATVSGGTTWTYEYTLNNSSFTASQWQAINSGITDDLVGQITTNEGNITTIQATMSGYGNIVTHNVSEFATAAQGTKADTAVQPADLATVATSGSYNDLDDKPTIGNATLTIQKNGTAVDTFTANATADKAINLIVPTDTSDLSNGAGYITGITSSDVTTALGYTPYNSSNPDGYTSNVGTVTSVNNTLPDGDGNVTITIPDPLPSQFGQSGKFLTTDGTNPSWQNVDALPSQTGQAGKYLTTDGTNPSWNTITIPSVDVDGISINRNASDQLQTIGVINQNSPTTALKTWTGTKAQYDAIVTKDPNTEYFCTDSGELYLGDVKIGSGSGLEIGDIGIAPLGIDELENKRRYLNGQVISQAQFEAFTSKLKSIVALYPNVATTEVNWQAEVTNSKLGQCGKFVIDDDAGTIRLPKVVNINGLQDLTVLGGIKAESLPNITGDFDIGHAQNGNATGSFRTTQGPSNYVGGQNSQVNPAIDFDASRSSSTYQDDAPVQQEAVQYPYFIQVATGVETSIDVSREIELNNPFSLLDYKYSEYELSNASWLLSNGQWNSGAVYPSVYDLLLQELNGTSSKLPYRSYVNTVGNLVNTDGVLSGFSASNYTVLENLVPFSSYNWEFVLAYKLSNLSSLQTIVNGLTNYTSGIASTVATNGKINLFVGNTGSNWNIGSATSSLSLSINADYLIKFSFNGTQYLVDVSADGGDSWTNYITMASTANISQTSKFTLGARGVDGGEVFSGTIDLNESYININGERWWTGRRKIITTTDDYADTDFVLNTTDTTFRLPLKVALASGNKIAGNGYSLGFTDGTVDGIVGLGLGYTSATGQIFVPFKINPVGTQNQYDASMAASSCIGITTDETKSGIETSANGLYLYFYVGEVVQDANIIAAGQALTDIADLKNASNFSQTGLSTLSGLGMPSDNYIDLTLGASGASYTAPANGWFFLVKKTTVQGQYIMLYNQATDFGFHEQAYGQNQELWLYIPAKKGDVMFLAYNAAGTTSYFRFYYAEGESANV